MRAGRMTGVETRVFEQTPDDHVTGVESARQPPPVARDPAVRLLEHAGSSLMAAPHPFGNPTETELQVE